MSSLKSPSPSTGSSSRAPAFHKKKSCTKLLKTFKSNPKSPKCRSTAFLIVGD